VQDGKMKKALCRETILSGGQRTGDLCQKLSVVKPLENRGL